MSDPTLIDRARRYAEAADDRRRGMPDEATNLIRALAAEVVHLQEEMAKREETHSLRVIELHDAANAYLEGGRAARAAMREMEAEIAAIRATVTRVLAEIPNPVRDDGVEARAAALTRIQNIVHPPG
jgi:endonuclease/exonuclease/phosphatase family metal-dependent hydrolase